MNPEVILKADPAPRGQATIVAEVAGKLIHSDQLVPADAEHRRKYIKDIAEVLPGLDGQQSVLNTRLIELGLEVEEKRKAQLAAALEAAKSKSTDRELKLLEVEPWPEPVDGAVLLGAIEQVIREHIVIGEYEIRAAALWSLWSWVFDRFDIAPQLVLTSPVSECGKTTLLTLISEVVPRALPASNISSAAVYRVIEEAQPTLMLDEADSYMAGPNASEELRGVLNSGHTRSLAFVVRCDGDDHKPRYFSTWCPRVIALIGKGAGSGLAATLEGRSIVLRMHRKKRGDTSVEKRIKRGVHRHLAELARKAARWAQDHQEECRDAEPMNMPDLATNRTTDNWVPLVVVADLAGGDWPRWAREAARALGGEDRSEFAGVELLTDIRKWFDEYKDSDRVSTSMLLEYLIGLDEHPWSTWYKGRKPLDPRGLAGLLAPFEIKSKSIRTATGTPKGYERIAFEDAWDRYLPTPPHFIRNTATQLNNKGNSENPSATGTPFVADSKNTQPVDTQQDNGRCCGVAGAAGVCRGEDGDPGFDDDDIATTPTEERVGMFPRRTVEEKQIHVQDATHDRRKVEEL